MSEHIISGISSRIHDVIRNMPSATPSQKYCAMEVHRSMLELEEKSIDKQLRTYAEKKQSFDLSTDDNEHVNTLWDIKHWIEKEIRQLNILSLSDQLINPANNNKQGVKESEINDQKLLKRNDVKNLLLVSQNLGGLVRRVEDVVEHNRIVIRGVMRANKKHCWRVDDVKGIFDRLSCQCVLFIYKHIKNKLILENLIKNLLM